MTAAVYPALEGDQKLKIGVLDESRGCPNRCAFCIHPIKSGGKWHMKSPARVAAEVRRLMDQLGSRCFIYSGSNTSARVAIDIAQELLKERLDVRYGCFGHVRSIGKADFELLRRSGCEAIFYGLESGSERILREAFNKPLDLAEAERVIRQTKEAGICAIASVIYPAPFEDEESRRATLEFLRRVRPDSVPVTIPGMIPGTPWEKDPEKYGFKKSERADLWEYGLTYKIKLLFPPSLWKPLPYTLNGKSSKQLFAECEAFIRDIEAEGLVTDLSHESVLMADALGAAERPSRFPRPLPRDVPERRHRADQRDGAKRSIAMLRRRLRRKRQPVRARSHDRYPAIGGSVHARGRASLRTSEGPWPSRTPWTQTR